MGRWNAIVPGEKRAQATLFIILGVVVLGLAIGGFFLLGDQAERQSGQSLEHVSDDISEAQPVLGFIQACVEKTAEEGLRLLGQQGGHIQLHPGIRFGSAAYWYLDQVNIQPTLNQSLAEYQEYLDTRLPSCLDYAPLEAQGFRITAGLPRHAVSFNAEDVNVEVDYPVTIERGDYRTSAREFSATPDIRYRRTFEMATRVLNAHFDPLFRRSDPLLLVDRSGYTVSALPFDASTTRFRITDPLSLEGASPYVFQFVSRYNRSTLPRRVSLQPESHINPTLLPFFITSLDRLAILEIRPGTTVQLYGSPVGEVEVRQSYETNFTRYNFPVHELADDSLIYRNRTWNLTYPVYTFSPEGMGFNQRQRLRIYWDEDSIPHQGEMGLMYKSGEDVRPLPVRVNYGEQYVETEIQGFSQYSAVDCRYQERIDTSSKAEIEPSTAGCVVKGFLYVVSGGVAFVIDVLLTAINFDFYNNWIGYGSDKDDCISFTATCAQTLDIDEDVKDGDGQCIPNGNLRVAPGQGIELCAQIEQCDKADRVLCRKCSTTCKTTYK